MSFEQGSLHLVVLRTAEGEPFLTGDILRIAQHAVDSLASRYPGLRVTGRAFRDNAVSLLLDFSRCDEDTARVVQSYKTEVRRLSTRKGFKKEHFWQREYVEKTVESQEERAALLVEWNF